MTALSNEPGSFRDPRGRIYYVGDRVLRTVTDVAVSDFEFVRDSGLTDALQEHVKQQIGKWKYPRWIEIVDDLPKTATGKIQRFKLRDG